MRLIAINLDGYTAFITVQSKIYDTMNTVDVHKWGLHIDVLEKQKIILDEFREPDRTYITLLERFPGLDINRFNEILKKRNLKVLGSKSNSKNK